MNKILEQLDAEFSAKVQQLIDIVAKRDIEMVPYCGIRHPIDQAKIWRQSRTKRQVEEAIYMLELNKADFIIDQIREAGPQKFGPWGSNSLPGESWHQWGRAVDFYVTDHAGHPNWNSSSMDYSIVADESRRLGLTSGYYWNHRDAVHLQADGHSVLAQYDWKQIDTEMKSRYGKNIDNTAKVK